ncbi:MAG TPA: F0F1 ATP synthase subunit gamma [Syntrophales bacterium]|nr:F0F1 ATP synthase subunit gamma [Syntrophales bacterium]HOL59378.1 F0F1 ATP synthase subunit gamma [Syntrophales bacterium]HPO35535.1 F0F1 ATP synthase subunit gamma [Syntrophales bacterium]
MQTMEALKRKIKSAQDLHSVVKTMKALAAVSIRQYQRAVESLADYNRSVEMGFHVVLKYHPPEISARLSGPPQRIGAIVFGSDQGLCGPLNENIAHHALEEMASTGVPAEDRYVIALGMRIEGYLLDGGQEIIETLSMPNSVGGITPMVQDLIMIIEDWYFRRQIDHIYLFYNEYQSGATYRPRTLTLLPIDQRWLKKMEKAKWPSRVLPIYTIKWDTLFTSLVKEYLFVSLYRAFAESLASENASRLAAMQNAEKNIEERIQELTVMFHRQRQMTITEELLDIVAGFEALKGAEKKEVTVYGHG